MKMISPTRWVSLALELALLLAPLAKAQTPSTQSNASSNSAGGQSQKQDSAVRLRTDEVVVDAIVTDKKNRPVMNLTADDFDLFEDGVKQRIASFRVQTAGQTTDAQDVSGSAQSQPSSRPGIPAKLVSMVFDSETTRDTALLARRAALEYIESGMGTDDYVAVFGIDHGLIVLAPFTQDRSVLKRAVESFTSRESKRYGAVATEVRQSLDSMVQPLPDAEKIAMAETISAADVVPPATPVLEPGRRDNPGAIDPARVIRTEVMLSALQMLRSFDVYEKQFQAYTLVNALLAIINGQRLVRASRKTLMLFSEGTAIPADVGGQFLSVISSANKAGVTIYALDIGGLRLVNPNSDAMLERDAAAAKRLRNPNPDLVTNGASALGRMEDTARMNAVTNLDELSEETGGYTIKNTNDLAEGVKRIVDLLANYYVLTYVSTNDNYDGRFRRITLKLKQPSNFQLRARQGYYALRTLDESPVMAQELPLLDRLNRSASDSDFPLYGEVLHFRGTAENRLVAVYLEFPMSALKPAVDEKAKTFSSKFVVLALIKNSSGQIVRKLGQEFAVRGPVAQIDDLKKQPQIYSRLIMLEPGKYILDGVARDSATGKTAIVHNSFEVPGTPVPGLTISSVVLSRGVNPLTDEQKKQGSHPLYLEGQAYFVPNVSQVFNVASDKNLLVNFSVYARKTCSVALEFYRNGTPVAQSTGALPDPDVSGRISYVTSFGMANFPPGQYELRVTANDGSGRATSSAQFEVRP
jgi:VWFA-related protein